MSGDRTLDGTARKEETGNMYGCSEKGHESG